MNRCLKNGIKTLLVAMPWADYQFPSIQIGCLLAYARQKGYWVEGAHLHLEAAAHFGFEKYDGVVRALSPVGDLIFASYYYPEHKREIIKHLNFKCEKPERNLEILFHIIHNIYRNVNWKIYDIVGFTITSEQVFASLLFAKWLKRDYPNIRIVFGGPLVNAQRGIGLLKCFPEVDWCVDGEGEVSFVSLLDCLSRGENVGDCVPGLVYRSGSGIRINPRQQLFTLEDLPDPDFKQYFKLLNNHSLIMGKEITPYLLIECSRGCMYNCAYCVRQVYWKGYRTRSPETVAGQIKRMVRRYGTGRIRFVDSLIPMKDSKQLFTNIAKHNCDYYMSFDVRADVRKEQLEAMRRAGICQVVFGFETLSTNLLKKMNKGIRFIENLQAMKFCEELGMEYYSNLILGFPTETQADIDESVNNIEYTSAYCPQLQCVPFKLYYGVPVYKKLRKYGISRIRNPKALNHIFPRAIVDDIFLSMKEFSSNHGDRDYGEFFRRLERWRKEYNQALLDGKNLLSYYDCNTYLRIEDYRSKINGSAFATEQEATLTLAEEARELYLFCDSYKSWDEIKKRFPKWDEREIKKVLNKLVKLKVMFREDDDYLSLAIRANGPR